MFPRCETRTHGNSAAAAFKEDKIRIASDKQTIRTGLLPNGFISRTVCGCPGSLKEINKVVLVVQVIWRFNKKLMIN